MAEEGYLIVRGLRSAGEVDHIRDRFRRALICHYAPASCTEVAEFYPLFDFDGNRLNRDAAVGGGPCGTVAEEAATAPH